MVSNVGADMSDYNDSLLSIGAPRGSMAPDRRLILTRSARDDAAMKFFFALL
jgi:hypothetical protein